MENNNNKIQIPFPKWKWWQTGIILICVILTFKTNLSFTEFIEVIKDFLEYVNILEESVSHIEISSN